MPTRTSNIAAFDDDDDCDDVRRRQNHRTGNKSWLPRFSQSAIDCFRSCSKDKRKNSKVDSKNMAEMYYNALQSELRISNPYLYDGRETPNREIYRQSWKLEPFPALPHSQTRRRCRSDSNVARHSLLVKGHDQRCQAVARDMAQKKNWLKESKMKLEELFRRKCRLLVKKRTSSLFDVRKQKVDGDLDGNRLDADPRLGNALFRPITPQDHTHANGTLFCPIDYGDQLFLNGPHSPNSDPNIWRQKLEKWATSLQCAIQVIKREENMRLEIRQLRMHRELLEHQLEEISDEKERWRRKCIELQKAKRRSTEAVTCQQCGGLAFQFKGGSKERQVLRQLPVATSDISSSDENRSHHRDLNDDEIFSALHDLILYYA